MHPFFFLMASNINSFYNHAIFLYSTYHKDVQIGRVKLGAVPIWGDGLAN